MATSQFLFKINDNATTISSFDTTSCFNSGYHEDNISPIDNCLKKIQQLNLIHTQYATITPTQENLETTYNLILLGYISAIESYIREIIRKIIITDKISRVCCELEEINYGSAINYPKHLLPEVILEKASFASQENIINSFKKFLGLKGHQPNELLETLSEFEKICHLRHCIVHRFGKLGSHNAIKFGLDDHAELIEKPLNLDVTKVYNLTIICTNTVLVVNNHLFNKILERTASGTSNIWKWDLRKDKKPFEKYYNLFNSTLRPSSNSSLKETYQQLKNYYISL